MSTATMPMKRHALGLPAGSIRAAHVIGVVALSCAIIVVPSRGVVAIPPYLIYLLFLLMGHYFAAHGVTIATRDDPSPSPLYLPGGVVRTLIIIALGGSIGWKLYDNMPGLRDQFTESLKGLQDQPYLPLVVLAVFSSARSFVPSSAAITRRGFGRTLKRGFRSSASRGCRSRRLSISLC